MRGDDAWVDDFVRRAKDNGFTSFCLTVDVASYSRRERDLVGRFVKPWRARAQEGAAFQAGALLGPGRSDSRTSTTCRSIIKGIATVEDAEIAVQHGVEVVYVSNHGGRQLDHGLGSTAVLPEIVKAVEERAEVWVDGGYMRGSDVVKAIALGAKTRRHRAPHRPRASARPARQAWCARWSCSRRKSASASACSASLRLPSSRRGYLAAAPGGEPARYLQRLSASLDGIPLDELRAR